MESAKQIRHLKREESDRFRHAFLKGMSNFLVFGKKPQTKKFYSNFEALNHDISFLREDLIEALTKVIGELSPEKKKELKNKLIEIEVEEGYPQMTFEFEDNSKNSKNEQKEKRKNKEGHFR